MDQKELRLVVFETDIGWVGWRDASRQGAASRAAWFRHDA